MIRRDNTFSTYSISIISICIEHEKASYRILFHSILVHYLYNKIFISLPGVPYEMQGIMTEQAIPKLKKRFKLKSMYYKTALTQGIGESFLAEKIEDWENLIYKNGLSLAYLPSAGIVKLRISSAKGSDDAAIIDSMFVELENLIPNHFFGYDRDTLPQIIGQQLIDKKLTIGTVESCTAGMLASQISSIPGASAYYEGALLTYSYKIKTSLANVTRARR